MNNRCAWVKPNLSLYIDYHDYEWGVAITDDCQLFEFLTLEGAQAGLSWITILKKRENYRQAFANFDPQIVAKFDEAKIQELLQNPGIVRNQLKLRATITNAQNFLKVQQEYGSFARYIWQFVDYRPIQNNWKTLAEIPTSTPESNAMSKDLKKRGFKFVGTTICYAFMQAVGMVNDHTVDCFRYEQIADQYQNFCLK